MKICEVFESIQGEGPLIGVPMLFICLSGCNRNCAYCDSKYHTEGYECTTQEITNTIRNSNMSYVCWTGGEPTLQIRGINEVVAATNTKHHTLETNGTIRDYDVSLFKSVTVAPKDEVAAKYWHATKNASLKVVTDLETVNCALLKYADYLMPLTTFDTVKDEEIKKRVWQYCTEHNFKYSPRLHIDLWGNKRCK